MANEVYLLTHDGLSQMVSARAATRFLDKALEAKGFSSDSVTSEDMREILQGPILRELRQILPKDGVERSIKQISRNLRKQAEKVAEAMLAVANAPAVSQSPDHLPSVSGDVLLTGEDEPAQPTPEQVMAYKAAEADLDIVSRNLSLEEAQTFDTGEVTAALDQALNSTTFTPNMINAAPSNDTLVEFTPVDFASVDFTPADFSPVDVTSVDLASAPVVTAAQQVTTASAVAAHDVVPASVQTTTPDYSPEKLAIMLVRFAQLEHVKVVAAVKPNGEVSMARGSGFDVDALSRLGSLGIKLLSRNRKIRSYYLSQSRYQLFLFPLYSHTSLSQTLIVVGSSEVNVGDVFSVRSHLEEDL